MRYRKLQGSPPRFLVQGATRPELFEHAAEAMFSLSHDLSSIAPTYSRPIVAPGDTYPELLVFWLEELRFMSMREGIVWSWFAVDRLEEGGVQGSASGLPANELAIPSEVALQVQVVSDGLVEIPDGWWVEIEFEMGSPVQGMV